MMGRKNGSSNWGKWFILWGVMIASIVINIVNIWIQLQ